MHSELRLHGLNPERILNDYVDRRLNFVLSRFGERIGRVTTRVTAAAGGSAQCRITAELRPFGAVITTAQDADVFAAIDRCVGRLARRCQSKSMRSRNGRSSRISIRNSEHFMAA